MAKVTSSSEDPEEIRKAKEELDRIRAKEFEERTLAITDMATRMLVAAKKDGAIQRDPMAAADMKQSIDRMLDRRLGTTARLKEIQKMLDAKDRLLIAQGKKPQHKSDDERKKAAEALLRDAQAAKPSGKSWAQRLFGKW